MRGSVPVPGPSTVFYGGNTSCVELRVGSDILILDAGTGIRALGRKLMQEFGENPVCCTVLLSHTHWDHIQGLPFFQPVYHEGNHVRILGYEGALTRSLNQVLSRQMESPYFPVNLPEVPARIEIEEFKDMNFSLGKIRVEAMFANHPGTCLGYKLSTGSGSLAYFPDNESYLHLLHSASGERPTPVPAAIGRERQQKLIDFLTGVDFLVTDTQYDRDEYPEHAGWGHGCLDDVVDMANQAKVGTLFLFHHDPEHDDAKMTKMLTHARSLVVNNGRQMRVEAAREGLTVSLKSERVQSMS